MNNQDQQYEMDNNNNNNNNQQTEPLTFIIPYNDNDNSKLDMIIQSLGGPNNIDRQNCYQDPNDDKGDYFIEIYLKN